MELFRSPWVLGLLAAAVAFAAALAAFESARREALLRAWGLPETLAAAVPSARRRLKSLLGLAGLALLFLSLAGPQWGTELLPSVSDVRHVVLAIDLSASMLAEDIKPSRLERAKEELTYLVESLRGDRVGVIAFAGRAHVHCPLTTDTAAALLFLKSLEVGSVPQPGTAVGEAVRLADTMLSRAPGPKALVLISDGEDTLASGEVEAAQAAAKNGVMVYALGIGTAEGAPIPLRSGGTLEGYKKDKQGRTVVTRLEESGLRALAAASGGDYLHLSESGAETADLLQRLKNLGTTKVRQSSGRRLKDRYQWPLCVAWLLLFLAVFLPEDSSSRPRSPGRARAGAAVLLALAALFPARPARAGSSEDLSEASRALKRGAYDEALRRLQSAAQSDPKDARIQYQLGSTLYRLGRFPEAAEAFNRASQSSDGEARRRSAFNEGNALYQAGKPREAAAAFRESVVADPGDKDSSHNLALALEKQKQDKQKQDKKKDQPDKKDESQKKDKGGGQDQKPQMSKEDAQRILQAVQEREQQMKPELLNKRLRKQSPQSEVEKDW